METINAPDQLAAERLRAELADVQASIELVATDVARAITLTGLRFGGQLAERLREPAAAVGVALETTFLPDDTAGDVHVSRMEPPHA